MRSTTRMEIERRATPIISILYTPRATTSENAFSFYSVSGDRFRKMEIKRCVRAGEIQRLCVKVYCVSPGLKIIEGLVCRRQSFALSSSSPFFSLLSLMGKPLRVACDDNCISPCVIG